MEKYFIEKLKLSNQFSNIGTYWEKGNQNEIDIVAINDLEKTMFLAEVKINSKKIDLYLLEKKATKLISKHSQYKVKFIGYSLKDL